MEEHYYLVPISCEDIYLDDIRLCDLYKKKEINKIPERLVIFKNKEEVKELITGIDVYSDNYDSLNCYEVFNIREMVDYFLQSNYKLKMIYLIKHSSFKKNKNLIRKISED